MIWKARSERRLCRRNPGLGEAVRSDPQASDERRRGPSRVPSECGLRRLVSDLVEVAGAVSVQAWPPAEAAEVPGLEALAMIGARRSLDLRSVAGDEHEAPAAGWGALHVDVNDVVFVHGFSCPFIPTTTAGDTSDLGQA